MVVEYDMYRVRKSIPNFYLHSLRNDNELEIHKKRLARMGCERVENLVGKGVNGSTPNNDFRDIVTMKAAATCIIIQVLLRVYCPNASRYYQASGIAPYFKIFYNL